MQMTLPHSNIIFDMIENIAASVRRIIIRHPFLYFSIVGRRESVKRLRAHRDSSLVVEAFPRSANTTSMFALYYAQGKSIKVGHHLHVPAHIVYAVKNNIPCLVIMRQPLDCIASLMVMRKGGNPKNLIKDYISFAQVVKENLDQVVVVDFQRVIAEGLGYAVGLVNERYNTSFIEPTNSPEEVGWVKERILELNAKHSGGDLEKLSFPSEEKKAKAEEMKNLIRKEGELLEVAQRLYSSLVKSK